MAISVSADKPLKDLDAFKAAGSSDKALTTDPSLNVSYLVAGKGGKTLLEFRQIGAKSYFQADAAGIATLAGQDATKVTEMADQLPPSFKVVKDALAGKWIGVDLNTLQDFGKSAAKGTGGALPSAPASLDPKVAQSFVASLKDAFSRDVTFEDKGKQDGAEHLVVSAPARRLADDLLNSLKSVAKDVPGLDKLPSSAPSSVPDRNLGVDVLVKDGALSSLGFDLAQLNSKADAGTHLPLKLTFGKDVPALQAPTGATEVTKADLDGLVSAMAGARGHAGTGATHTTLTNAQVKDLLAAGMTQADIKSATDAGMSYDQIKSVLSAGN